MNLGIVFLDEINPYRIPWGVLSRNACNRKATILPVIKTCKDFQLLGEENNNYSFDFKIPGKLSKVKEVMLTKFIKNLK